MDLKGKGDTLNKSMNSFVLKTKLNDDILKYIKTYETIYIPSYDYMDNLKYWMWVRERVWGREWATDGWTAVAWRGGINYTLR